MTQEFTILTGASRGMGLAMARQLLTAGHMLLCISRKRNPELQALAEAQGAVLLEWTEDLAHAETVSLRLENWLLAQEHESFATATLINNAGVIPEIAPLSAVPGADLAQALRVGLEAPLLLSAAFLRSTTAWKSDRRILNISSGLGRRAMAAQAAYCAAKAGMDHFTRCLALEEALKPQGARVCALAPGVIDTDMQTQLRGASSADFPDHGSFVGLQRSGQLSTPEAAASRVLDFLMREDFGKQPVADVRD